MDEGGEQQRNFFLLSTRLSGFSLSKPSSAFENVRVPTATGPPRGPPASISLKKALANSQTKTNHHISSKISTFFYLNIAATLIQHFLIPFGYLKNVFVLSQYYWPVFTDILAIHMFMTYYTITYYIIRASS